MKLSFYFSPINITPTQMLVYWVVWIILWVWYVIGNMIVFVRYFIALLSELVQITEKGIFFVRFVYYYPSSGASILLVFIIDGLLMGKNYMSWASVTAFTHFPTVWSSVPSKPPRKIKINHRSTLFTLLPFLWTTLTSWSTPLLSLLQYDFPIFFRVLILNLYRSNFSDSVLLLQIFFNLCKYIYIL